MESEELESFRKVWKDEVLLKKQQGTHSNTGLPPTETSAPQHDTTDSITMQFSKVTLKDHNEASPIELYHQGTLFERQGKLGEALQAYRLAFRQNSNVEKEYYYSPLYQQYHQPSRESHYTGNYDEAEEVDEEGHNKLYMEISREDPHFLPIDASKPVYLETIPSEVVVHILKHLSVLQVQSLERFGRVSKKGFLLSRSQGVWHYLCDKTYQQQGVSREEVAQSLLAHQGIWRNVFIETPRIRFDGLYICVCTYLRPTSEMSWNSNVHIVTYYRYLRFFPERRCLTYTSCEEPSKVVKIVSKDMEHRKGLMRGEYRMSGNEVHLQLSDEIHWNKTFCLVLKKLPTHRGRHYRLGWVKYDCKDHSSSQSLDDILTFDTCSFKNFVFSRVKSYK